MNNITLSLPETLYEQLVQLAIEKNIPLNQYIIYALTRQVALGASLREIPIEQILQQRRSFNQLLDDLVVQVSIEEAQEILKNREVVQPEPELDSEVIARLQKRIDDAMTSG